MGGLEIEDYETISSNKFKKIKLHSDLTSTNHWVMILPVASCRFKEPP